MNRLDFDPAYSAGIRNLLITAATPAKRKRHLPWTIGLTVVGLSLLGAGGAVAATYLLPGQDIVTSLDEAKTITGTGPRTLALHQAPDGTNSLEYAIKCSSAGSITFPNGSSLTCSSSDARNPESLTSDTVTWTPGDHSFRLKATTGMRWRFTYRYSNRQPTNLATNANGQTYGIDTARGHPDLIAAIATNGRQGYINVADESAATCGDVHSPAEALRCNRETDGKTITIPVYQADGTTKIGVFEIQG